MFFGAVAISDGTVTFIWYVAVSFPSAEVSNTVTLFSPSTKSWFPIISIFASSLLALAVISRFLTKKLSFNP